MPDRKSPPRLPQELICDIFSRILLERRQDLKACSLVCRAFQQLAQKYFWSCIIVVGPTSLERLVQAFDSYPRLRTYVAKLEIWLNVLNYMAEFDEWSLFDHLCNSSLRELHLVGDLFASHRVFKKATSRKAIMKVLPRLELLSLHNIYETPLWVVTNCRRLRSLSIVDSYFVSSASHDIVEPPLHLQSLLIILTTAIDGVSISPICPFLVKSASSLQHLKLRMAEESGQNSPPFEIWNLLHAMEETLLDLRIGYHEYLKIDISSSLSGPFSIAQYPGLQEFEINLQFIHLSFRIPETERIAKYERELTWIAQIVECVTFSHPLISMCIYMDEDDYDLFGREESSIIWALDRLDLALGRREVFVQFEGLYLVAPRKEKEKALLRRLLPRLDQAGVLKLEGLAREWMPRLPSQSR